MAIKKPGIKECRRVTIRRNDETIRTHTYILTFEKPSIAKEIRIGYTIERVEQCIPAPCDVLSVKNFDITKKYVEDAKYVVNV